MADFFETQQYQIYLSLVEALKEAGYGVREDTKKGHLVISYIYSKNKDIRVPLGLIWAASTTSPGCLAYLLGMRETIFVGQMRAHARNHELQCGARQININQYPWRSIASQNGLAGGFQSGAVPGQENVKLDLDLKAEYLKAEWLSIVASVIKQYDT